MANSLGRSVNEKFHWRDYLAPRYWATWLGFGIFWCLSRLPYPTLMQVGKGLGRLMYLCLTSRRRIAQINIQLAFPDLSQHARDELVKQSFIQVGMASAETAWVWYRSSNTPEPPVFIGVEHLEAARAKGKGVILLQAHFTLIELTGVLVGKQWPVYAVYDPPKNALFDAYLYDKRMQHLSGLINNRSIREMVRCLRRGDIVWYSPDQSVAPAHGGIVTNYFGQPALTTSGTARILKMTGATLIPFIPSRNSQGSHYQFEFCAPLSLDVSDATLATQEVNNLLEAHVKQQPEQYLWGHKRFKPPNVSFSDPYA